MMITMNLHNVFFILMCSYALFSTFRESFLADCIEQFTTFERQFSGASWPGLERPLLRVTEKMQEKELTVFRPFPGQEFQTISDVIA